MRIELNNIHTVSILEDYYIISFTAQIENKRYFRKLTIIADAYLQANTKLKLTLKKVEYKL